MSTKEQMPPVLGPEYDQDGNLKENESVAPALEEELAAESDPVEKEPEFSDLLTNGDYNESSPQMATPTIAQAIDQQRQPSDILEEQNAAREVASMKNQGLSDSEIQNHFWQQGFTPDSPEPTQEQNPGGFFARLTNFLGGKQQIEHAPASITEVPSAEIGTAEELTRTEQPSPEGNINPTEDSAQVASELSTEDLKIIPGDQLESPENNADETLQ